MFHEPISLNSVPLLLLVNFVSGFRLELMYISFIVSIRSSLISMVFSCFWSFHSLYKSLSSFVEPKVKFRQAINCCKRALEAAKLAYANKKRAALLRNVALGTFGELPIVFLTKVILLYLLFSTTRRCCLLPLVKQNCLLKTFLSTLILMTQVSLYLFPF